MRKLLILTLAVLALASCRTTKVVTIPEYHSQVTTRVDTVHVKHTTDTREKTVVRELDSAAMAAYGIRLDGLQKAWLVETDRLRSEIDHLRQSSQDITVRIDTIPVPYPVDRPVPQPLSWWQRLRMNVGGITIAFFFICLSFYLVDRLRKRRS